MLMQEQPLPQQDNWAWRQLHAPSRGGLSRQPSRGYPQQQQDYEHFPRPPPSRGYAASSGGGLLGNLMGGDEDGIHMTNLGDLTTGLGSTRPQSRPVGTPGAQFYVSGTGAYGPGSVLASWQARRAQQAMGASMGAMPPQYFQSQAPPPSMRAAPQISNLSASGSRTTADIIAEAEAKKKAAAQAAAAAEGGEV